MGICKSIIIAAVVIQTTQGLTEEEIRDLKPFDEIKDGIDQFSSTFLSAEGDWYHLIRRSRTKVNKQTLLKHFKMIEKADEEDVNEF